MNSSMAGTEKSYVGVQGRIYHDGHLHIQGVGAKVNRSYGVAVEVSIPEGLATWWAGLAHIEKSLATGVGYVGFQVRLRDGTIHAQVEGGEFNRDYGAAFDITDCTPLVAFLVVEDGGDEDSGVSKEGSVTL